MATSGSLHKEDLLLRQLTSSATDDEVRAVMELSERVFVAAGAVSNPDKHGSFAYWRQKLADPRSSIVVVSVNTGANRLLGFFFNHARVHETVGVECWHIWLAAVDEEARGLGIFPMLMERTMLLARSQGYGQLTVATMPGRFVKMYNILRVNGWEEVSWSETEHGRKVFMKLTL